MNWLQKQNENRQDTEELTHPRKGTWKDILFREKVFGWTAIALIALCPVLVYYLVVDRGTFTQADIYTCLVNETFRVHCGRYNFTEKACLSVNCCFDVKKQYCYHSVPSRYYYQSEGDHFAPTHRDTPIGTLSTQKLTISVDDVDADTVRIILHNANRIVPTNTLPEKNYVVKAVNQRLQVEVYRNNDQQDRLLTTAHGPLIASEKYSEWTVYLTNHSLFGINRTLILPGGNSTFKKVIYNNRVDHYSSPVFWAFFNGKFHGVRVKHEGPLEIEILPSLLVVLRSVTGGVLELVVSVGPTPKELHDQQTTVTAASRLPFWVMQTHVCRSSSNRNVTEVIEEFRKRSEDYDTYCIDENILLGLLLDDLKNVTIIKDTLTEMSERGKKIIISVPPQLPVNSTSLFSTATNLDILYRLDGEIYRGKYRNTSVVYPDFSHNHIQQYMQELDKFIGNYVDINIDGFILKDNWPIDESYAMKDNTSFPYFDGEIREAFSYTIPWNATVNKIPHIHNHNSYGLSHTSAFREYFNNSERQTVILSSAKLFGHSQSVEMIQNVDASWDNLGQFIDNLLFNSITGNHIVSVPVCGDTANFDSDLQQTLCIRWYLVALTMPFLRVSSGPPWRDPDSLKSTFATGVVKTAMDKRKTLLRHYYTIIERNEPLIRPMFYDYHEDVTTFLMKNQYAIGENIVVAHPLSDNRNKLRVYLPPRVGVWYEMWGGRAYQSNNTHNQTEIDIVNTDLVAFVAQGSIIPLTVENEINLIVALNCTSEPCLSEGKLLLNDMVSFTADNSSITIADMPSTNCNYTLGYIKLYFTGDMSLNNSYIKNLDMCDKGSVFTVVYENEDEVTTSTATSTTIL